MTEIISNFHKLVATAPDVNFWEVMAFWVVVIVAIVIIIRKVVKNMTKVVKCDICGAEVELAEDENLESVGGMCEKCYNGEEE